MSNNKSEAWKALLLIAVFALGSFVSCTNRERVYTRDRDDNPPGPVGGPGTNWENPPGPAGGPGTSPDRRAYRSAWDEWFVRHPTYRDQVDLNRDGYVDAREAQYAQRHWPYLNPPRDRDDNPPGPTGGPGTNWENPPGPQGGPGTSPARRSW